MRATATWRDWSCSVRVVTGADALDRAAAIVRATMASVGDAASRFRADSEITACNERAGLPTPVSPVLGELVATALLAAERTGGAVDLTVGTHLCDIGYDADIDVVRSTPRPSAFPRPRRALPSWRDVRLDRELDVLRVPHGARLDLGATAKPWAADRAAAQAGAELGAPVLVEIGGDVAVAGAERDPFVVHVAEREGGPGENVKLRRGGLATSTTTQRRWRLGDVAAHHIVDPATGLPAREVWRTATVWAESAVDANVASTAAIVLGDAAPGWLAEHAPTSRLVSVDGVVTTLAGWPRHEVAA